MSLGGLSAPDANAAGHHRDVCLLRPRRSPSLSRQLTCRTVRYACWLFTFVVLRYSDNRI